MAVNFYNLAGGSPCHSTNFWYVPAHNSAYKSAPVSGCNPLISANVTTSSNVTATVNQVNGVTVGSYTAAAAPTRVVYIPLWMVSYNGWNFNTLNIFNGAPGQANPLKVTYYNQNGMLFESRSYNLYDNQTINLSGVPSGSFIGTAVVEAKYPVSVVVNYQMSGTTWDGFMTTSGVGH
jgi:hypothetical protein